MRLCPLSSFAIFKYSSRSLKRRVEMKKRSENDGVNRAIETFDHLLWEAITRASQVPISQFFEQSDDSARVVYKVDSLYIDCERIEEELEKMIEASLPIIKIKKKRNSYHELRQMCTHVSYQFFLDQIFDNDRRKTDIEFVKIGDAICAPCCGKHLNNTNELNNFIIKWESKKVSSGVYKFSFKITAK